MLSHRLCSDQALLWLWWRPTVVAVSLPGAWELPYATGAALKSKKKGTVETLERSKNMFDLVSDLQKIYC